MEGYVMFLRRKAFFLIFVFQCFLLSSRFFAMQQTIVRDSLTTVKPEIKEEVPLKEDTSTRSISLPSSSMQTCGIPGCICIQKEGSFWNTKKVELNVPGTVIELKDLKPVKKEDIKEIKPVKFQFPKIFSSQTSTARDVIKIFIEKFLPFKRFMHECLYNPAWGYYSAGRVQFGGKVRLSSEQVSENTESDFGTYPSMYSPDFGAMLAYNAYGIWISMLKSGDIKKDEPFEIVEFGAGPGRLAFDFLETVSLFAEKFSEMEKAGKINTKWREFYEVLRYRIGEYSPELMERQRKLNQRFIDSKKLEIIKADARGHAMLREGKKIKGLVLSNELPDAFPVHKVQPTKDGRVEVCIRIPILKKDLLKQDLQKSDEVFKKMNNAIEKKGLEGILSFKELLSDKDLKELDTLLKTKDSQKSLDFSKNLYKDLFGSDKDLKKMYIFIETKFQQEMRDFLVNLITMLNKGALELLLQMQNDQIQGSSIICSNLNGCLLKLLALLNCGKDIPLLADIWIKQKEMLGNKFDKIY